MSDAGVGQGYKAEKKEIQEWLMIYLIKENSQKIPRFSKYLKKRELRYI
jgi:hypothetical protein